MVKVKEWGVSFIRTSVVPPTAGFVSAWLVNHHVTQIHSSWVFSGVTLVLSAVWYAFFRGLELASRNPRVKKFAGVLLGYARAEVPAVIAGQLVTAMIVEAKDAAVKP